MSDSETIQTIIARAGGAKAIQTVSRGKVRAGAIYKWPKIGIPDRHWPLIMKLSGSTEKELLAANISARQSAEAAE